MGCCCGLDGSSDTKALLPSADKAFVSSNSDARTAVGAASAIDSQQVETYVTKDLDAAVAKQLDSPKKFKTQITPDIDTIVTSQVGPPKQDRKIVTDIVTAQGGIDAETDKKIPDPQTAELDRIMKSLQLAAQYQKKNSCVLRGEISKQQLKQIEKKEKDFVSAIISQMSTLKPSCKEARVTSIYFTGTSKSPIVNGMSDFIHSVDVGIFGVFFFFFFHCTE